MSNTQHVEDSLAKIRVIFEKASDRIEALKPGEKVPATKLAEELAKECGTTGPSLYPVLKYLLDGYPGVEIKRGAMGGIYRPMPTPVILPTPADPSEPSK
jgi:hypothetical protein